MFGVNMRNLRESLALSREELALRLNTSEMMIAHYENGVKVPSMAVAYEISVALGTTVNQLINGTAE